MQKEKIDLHQKLLKIMNRNRVASKPQNDSSILVDMIKLQELLQYDRKKRNSVTKVVIDILKEENIEIKFNISKKDCSIAYIKSIDSVHFKKSKNKIEMPIHDEAYVEMVRKLLTFKALENS